MINSYIFFLFFLGTNFLLLVKKSGQISFELFMTLMVCMGSFIQYGVGQVFYYSRIPYYSEMAAVAIGSANILVLDFNQVRNNHISITFNKETKGLIAFFLAFLVVRLFTVNGSDVYLDDQYLFKSAMYYCSNAPNILELRWFVPYFNKEVDVTFEIPFSIAMGIVMKSGWPAFITPANIYAFETLPPATIDLIIGLKIFVKIYFISLNSFVIFPTYAYLSRIIKERKARFIMLAMLVLNQLIFIESPYLIVDMTFMLFFTAAFYYFILVLEKEGNTDENLIFCTIATIVAYSTRYNGFVQIVIQILLLCFIYIFPKVQDRTIHGKKIFGWLSKKISLPKITVLSRLFIFLLVVIVVFIVIPQLDYFIRNGITMIDFGLRINGGYFGPGSLGQFPAVDGFSFTWLWQRFSYNFPWYIINFTQLFGFIHVFSDDATFRISINSILSIVIFVIFGISMIYHWYKTSRKNLLSFFYQIALFLLMFASIILWGETYFQFYRWSYPIMIMIVPPIYGAFKDLLTKIKHSFKANFNEERAITILLLPFLLLALYSSICFLIPLLTRDVYILRAYVVWQFNL